MFDLNNRDATAITNSPKIKLKAKANAEILYRSSDALVRGLLHSSALFDLESQLHIRTIFGNPVASINHGTQIVNINGFDISNRF